MTDDRQTTRRTGWNLRRLVTLECPICRRTKETLPDATDPPGTARVVTVCDRCPEEGRLIDYFNAKGQQLNLDGSVMA